MLNKTSAKNKHMYNHQLTLVSKYGFKGMYSFLDIESSDSMIGTDDLRSPIFGTKAAAVEAIFGL